jgi:hypothetical protein
VKLRLGSPGLLHVMKIKEWAMRNKLQQEKMFFFINSFLQTVSLFAKA